jgi:hypothetical protein
LHQAKVVVLSPVCEAVFVFVPRAETRPPFLPQDGVRNFRFPNDSIREHAVVRSGIKLRAIALLADGETKNPQSKSRNQVRGSPPARIHSLPIPATRFVNQVLGHPEKRWRPDAFFEARA